jgi:D-proline reductase (dithiol) PrdB
VVARILEEEGLSTVIVMTFREVAEAVRPPRTVYVRFPIGLTLGAPGAAAQQRVIIEDALTLLQEAREPGSLRDLPYPWHGFDYGGLLSERRKQTTISTR